MRWLAWVAWVGLAACIAVAVMGRPSRRVTTELQRVDHVVVSADGRVVTVPAYGGGCTIRVALTASASATTVTLKLTAYTIEGANVACPADVRLLHASTVLRTPLGQRKIVDASSGHSVSYTTENNARLVKPVHLARDTLRRRGERTG